MYDSNSNEKEIKKEVNTYSKVHKLAIEGTYNIDSDVFLRCPVEEWNI